MKITEVIKRVSYTKPPKNVKVRVKTGDEDFTGLKYFIIAGKEFRNTEFGWLQREDCSGLGQLGDSDYLEERVGF